MSDIEYFSDEYTYESDEEMGFNECMSESDDEIMCLPEITSFEIPVDVQQYQWTKWCLQMKRVFGYECNYNTDTNLLIEFVIEDKGFILTAPKDAEYPYAPPTVEWKGDGIILSDKVQILHNRQLCIANWNICTDLYSFVINAMNTIRHSIDPIVDIDLDNELVKAIGTLGIQYEFDTDKDDLPMFDLRAKLKISDAQYLSESDRIVRMQNVEDRFGKAIKKILPIVHTLAGSEFYIDIIKRIIVSATYQSKLSKLEITMNETFYRSLVVIADSLNLDVDLTDLRSVLVQIDNVDIESDEKVLFIDEMPHSFTNDVSLVRPKFVKRVMAEIDTLKEAVKDFNGYIAVCETNIQLMKLLLIPDYDTPYGGGYFEFDIFITGDYPNSPPKVKFLTTGNGKVRFNPNLYNCGKVCLSVLNTWADNQWDPKTSTLTQVVLSINSMVFIEHPYTNEPGFYNALTTNKGRYDSNAYNKDIRKHTIAVAINEQLTNESTPFRGVIQNHWNAHSDATKAHYRDNFGLEM